MNGQVYVPSSPRVASMHLRNSWKNPLAEMSKEEFIRVWSSVAYLFPSLHPDGFDDDGSGWPQPLKRFASEALRRVDAGLMAEDELYLSDAQWAGVYDRMQNHTQPEKERRSELALISIN